MYSSTSAASSKRATQGFTLFELLVTIMIMVILLTCSLPVYRSHLQKMHRAQAKANLLQLAHCLTTSSVAVCLTPSDSYYRYEVTANAEAFELAAIPQGSQTDDVCGILTYNQRGQKGPADSETCW